ncbi:LysE family translocator [Marinomonas agarivorans]|nr:LysE family translocator [Marinomonas agarivorans]
MAFALLSVFIPTFFFVSITPGMCMTLAMTLGMTQGIKRTLWMMFGELVGVGLVAIAAAVGVAAFLLNYPDYFTAFKLVGAIYLAYIGIQMWRSKGKMAIIIDDRDGNINKRASRTELMTQGFVTAIANPKGWAFFVALLPPFLDTERSLTLQLSTLISIILLLEFTCLLIYASGGKILRALLLNKHNVRLLNRLSGSLMIGVGLWLGIS